MNDTVKAHLQQKSASDLLIFFKAFQNFVKKPPIKNGGLGNFRSLLKSEGLDPHESEKLKAILKLEFKANTAEPKSRKDDSRLEVIRLMNLLQVDCSLEDKKEKFDYLIEKAKARYISIMAHLAQKYFININIKNDQIYIDNSLKPVLDYVIVFNCYYWFEDIKPKKRYVKTGQLSLTFSNPGLPGYKVTRADLKIFSSGGDGESASELVLDSPAEPITGITNLLFRDKVEAAIKTQLTIQAKRYVPTKWKYLTGTYSTIGPGSETNLITGLMVLEQTDLEAMVAGGKPLEVSPVIHNILHRTRLYGNPSIFPDLDEHPSAYEIKKLKPYVSSYAGVYYHKAKGKVNENLDRVIHFYFTIKDNGDAIMHQPEASEPYRGRVRILKSKNDALIAYLDFLTNENTYRFTIYFNKILKGKDQDLLVGVYAGIERQEPFVPTAGRMVLRRIAATDIKNESDYIYSDVPVEKFTGQPDNAELTEILNGEDENNDFIESLPTPYEAFESAEGVKHEFAGTYSVYYLSTHQAEVYKVPLRIKPDGSVEMRTRDNAHLHQGRVIFNGNNRLSIYFRHGLISNSYFHILFSTSNNSVAKLDDHFYGVSSKFDSDGRPSGRLEVMIRNNYVFSEALVESFSIGTPEYHAENNSTDNLLAYLFGKSNRFVVAKRTVNSHFKRSGSHEEFFYAACYKCKTATSNKDLEMALKLLYQAYLHGFGSRSGEPELIRTEIKDSFKNVLSLNLTASPDSSDLPPMGFSEILDLLLSNAPN